MTTKLRAAADKHLCPLSIYNACASQLYVKQQCAAPPRPRNNAAKRTLVQLYAACMIELAVVAFLAFYEPPKDYNKCATAFFALGTTTIDLVLLAFIRCATYIVIAHRTPPSDEAADLWAERLSHVPSYNSPTASPRACRAPSARAQPVEAARRCLMAAARPLPSSRQLVQRSSSEGCGRRRSGLI